MNLKETIQSVATAYPRIDFAILFGSQAEGTASANSDIDLAVASNQGPLSSEYLRNFQEDLCVATGLPVDLVDLRSTEGPVLHEIFSRGQILFGEGSSAHDQAALRMIWWQDDFAPLFRQCAHTVIQQAFQ